MGAAGDRERRAILDKMTTAYIGMGANLPSGAGEPEATLAAAAERLGRLGRVVRRSSLYSTEPVGYSEQPRFVNAVVALETELGPRALLTALLDVEREFGRERATERTNGPRTLDLDILLYGTQRIDEPELKIPHPRLAERAFVLVPLDEIAAQAVDVRSGCTVGELRQRLFPDSDDENQAVVAMESEAWRPGCGGADGRAALRAGATGRDPSGHHDHGRG